MKESHLLGFILGAGLLAVTAAEAQTYTFSIFAGQTNATGTINGVGTNALFNSPHGLAADAAGNIYVADTSNAVIRQITPSGVVSTKFTGVMETVVSTNPTTRLISPFSFVAPLGLAVDSNTNLYISDDNKIYKRTAEIFETISNGPGTILTGGFVIFIAGSTNGFADGVGTNAGFGHAYGLGLDSASNIWVADEYFGSIRKVTPDGQVTTPVNLVRPAGTPPLPPPPHLPSFTQMNNPPPPFLFDYLQFTGVAVDGFDNKFFMDDTGYVNEFAASNAFIGGIFFGGVSESSRGIAVDKANNLYFARGHGNVATMIAPDGATAALGTLPTQGQISGVAVDDARNLYFADQDNSVIIKGTPVYPAFFSGQFYLSAGVWYLAPTTNNVFGYYNLGNLNFPIFYHYDLGFEYFIDGNDAQAGAYLYDYSTGTFFYTTPQVFPYLYDFTLNSWLYYFPDTNRPGHYTTNPRYFYNFAAGKIITK